MLRFGPAAVLHTAAGRQSLLPPVDHLASPCEGGQQHTNFFPVKRSELQPGGIYPAATAPVGMLELCELNRGYCQSYGMHKSLASMGWYLCLHGYTAGRAQRLRDP